MAVDQSSNLTDNQNFCVLLQGIERLESIASDVDIKRQGKQSNIYKEECENSKPDPNEEESLKIIKQTTYVARLAMILLVHGLQSGALYASRNAKCFSSLSSTVSYIREQKGPYEPPKHLLLQWERNISLIDLFTSNEGLYCSKRIAHDMFDICMETFDWLRSFANNNK